MTYTVSIEAAARQDIQAAFEWYEARRDGLGIEFLNSVAVVEETLSRAPLRFPVTTAPYRWARLRKFPYGLHYLIAGHFVEVLACVHFRQDPSAWPGTQR